MKVFLAGAGGAIGRRLTPLLRAAGHSVSGTTRSADKVERLRALGATPVVVDVFDAAALTEAVRAAGPDVVMHQLTDLPYAPGSPQYAEGLARNARLRIEGTRNLTAAARAAGVARFIAQSVAFIYAEGPGIRGEADALDPDPARAMMIGAVRSLEDAALATPQGIVLRYGYLYGPGTWYERAVKPPSVHVDAAAQAAANSVNRGGPGIYNVAEDDGAVSSAKAKAELGFDAGFRINP